jgi:hypothetical protein
MPTGGTHRTLNSITLLCPPLELLQVSTLNSITLLCPPLELLQVSFSSIPNHVGKQARGTHAARIT